MTFEWALLAPFGFILILLCFSGFFSGSETALTAVSPARMNTLENEGDARAKRVTKLISDRERLIGGILLGNNLVNILATAIATVAFTEAFGPNGAAVATVVMTVLVLVFAEVMPKTYAISNTDRMAMAVSWPIMQIVRVLSPVVMTVQAIVRGTLAVFGVRAEGAVLSARDEIRGAIELHHQQGAVAPGDRAMLGGILDLAELTVEDVMIHRKSMEMLDVNTGAAALTAAALESRHTRLPLWQGDQENIQGVLHAKDLARALHAAGGDIAQIDVLTVAREPWFVPETTTLLEQLNAFRARREHFALVVDEYGALMGLVTLEDILEEIVGEINDEYDKPVEGVKRQKDGSVLVHGSVTIRDLNRAMHWDLSDAEAVTVAGLVIHSAQTIPEVGQVFIFDNTRFEIVERKRNQIARLRVSVIGEAAKK